jgi:hypothetical protein
MSIIETHGVLRGNVVELEEHPTLPEGVRVKVKLELEEATQPSSVTAAKEERRAAWARALARMEKGYHLGGPPYPKREELYDRFDRKGAGGH